MSRPARAGSAGKPVTIRATDAERERWERCAELTGADLSTLVRSSANQRCDVIERDLRAVRGNSKETAAKSSRNPRRKT